MEGACRKNKVAAAANVKVAQAKRDEARIRLRALEKGLKVFAESASNKGCKEEDTVDCKEWNKRMADAVNRVVSQTNVVGLNLRKVGEAIAAHNSAKAKNCDLNCKEGKSCMPNGGIYIVL